MKKESLDTIGVSIQPVATPPPPTKINFKSDFFLGGVLIWYQWFTDVAEMA